MNWAANCSIITPCAVPDVLHKGGFVFYQPELFQVFLYMAQLGA